jgi:hypothetical protein
VLRGSPLPCPVNLLSWEQEVEGEVSNNNEALRVQWGWAVTRDSQFTIDVGAVLAKDFDLKSFAASKSSRTVVEETCAGFWKKRLGLLSLH